MPAQPDMSAQPARAGVHLSNRVPNIKANSSLELALKPRTIPKPAPPPARLGRWRTLLTGSGRVVLALWVWSIALQVKVHPALAGLDHSGAFTFNYAHARGMVFGRDVAFT